MTQNSRPVLMLDVAAISGGIRCSISERQAHGLGTVCSSIEQSVDLARLLGLHGEVISALNRANRYGGLERGAFELLRQRGQMLFDELLPPPVKERLRRTTVRDLILVLDESLVFLPWELLHTGRGFLALLFNMGRMVRTPREVLGPARVLGERGARRMLVLCDPRSDLMASYYEGVMLRDELDERAPFLEVALHASEVGVADVKATIRDFDIVHYAGHAESEPTSALRGGWKLSDGVLGAQDILKLAGGAPFPALVFANACSSGHVDHSVTTEEAEQDVYGLAHAFLLAGVGHYVGTLWEVPDESSSRFSLAFYRALVRGESVGRSLMAARGELLSQYGVDNVLWAAYVLYGDPTTALISAGLVDAGDSGQVVHLPPPPPESGRRRRARAAEDTLIPPSLTAVRVRSALADRATAVAPSALHAWVESVLPWAWAVALVMGGILTTWLVADANRGAPAVVLEPIPPTPTSSSFSVPPSGTAALAEALPRAMVTVRAQGVDARGEGVERVVEDGGEVPVGASFQLALQFNQPAHVVLYHLSEQGDVVEVARFGPADWKRLRREGEAILPEPGAWFFVDGPPGLHTLIAAASDAPPLDLELLEDDLVRIQREVLTESPAYRVQTGPRVSIADGRRDERVEVTYMPVDRMRLAQAVSTRVRKSMDTVAVTSFFAR